MVRTGQEARAYADGLQYVAGLEPYYRALGEKEIRAVIDEFFNRGLVINPYAQGIVDGLKVLVADLHDEAAAS